MADRGNSAGDGPVDVAGEKLVVVHFARSQEELAEVMRLLEGGGLSPVDLPTVNDGQPASPLPVRRVAVPASEAARARRLIAERQGCALPWLAGLDPKVRRTVIRVLVLVILVLAIPLIAGLFFSLWVVGVVAIIAAALVEAVRRFFGGGGRG